MKDVKFVWTEKCEKAFLNLKKCVTTTPILRRPNWELPFYIAIDTSDMDMGVVLGKLEEKKPYAIYYISKNLTPAELNYTITEKEFLAVVHAINKFRHYITIAPCRWDSGAAPRSIRRELRAAPRWAR